MTTRSLGSSSRERCGNCGRPEGRARPRVRPSNRRCPHRERADPGRRRRGPDHVRACGRFHWRRLARVTAGRKHDRRSRWTSPQAPAESRWMPSGFHHACPWPAAFQSATTICGHFAALGPDRRVDRAVVLAYLVHRRPDHVLDALGDERLHHRLHVALVLVDVVVVPDVDHHDRAERPGRAARTTSSTVGGRKP